MVKVVSADYLCAIALQTGRAKDFMRIHMLIKSGHVSSDKLAALVNAFAFTQRWEIYVRRYA